MGMMEGIVNWISSFLSPTKYDEMQEDYQYTESYVLDCEALQRVFEFLTPKEQRPLHRVSKTWNVAIKRATSMRGMQNSGVRLGSLGCKTTESYVLDCDALQRVFEFLKPKEQRPLHRVSKTWNVAIKRATSMRGMRNSVVRLGSLGCKTTEEAILLVIEKKFQRVHLSYFPVTDEDLKTLVNGTGVVRSLTLSYCKEFTDEGIARIAEWEQLEELFLAGCPQLSDKGLAHLAKLKQLKKLDLCECTQITNEGRAKLKEAIPGVEINLEFNMHHLEIEIHHLYLLAQTVYGLFENSRFFQTAYG
ncbi:MAG: F-box protein [Waddliaceae bacterium]